MNLNNMIFDTMPKKDLTNGILRQKQENGLSKPKFNAIFDDSFKRGGPIEKDLQKKDLLISGNDILADDAVISKEDNKEVPDVEKKQSQDMSGQAEMLMLNCDVFCQEEIDMVLMASEIPIGEAEIKIKNLIRDFVSELKNSMEIGQVQTGPDAIEETINQACLKKVIKQAVLNIFDSIRDEAAHTDKINPALQKMQNIPKPFIKIIETVSNHMFENINLEDLKLELQNVIAGRMAGNGQSNTNANPIAKADPDNILVGTIKSVSARIANSFAKVVDELNQSNSRLHMGVDDLHQSNSNLHMGVEDAVLPVNEGLKMATGPDAFDHGKIGDSDKTGIDAANNPDRPIMNADNQNRIIDPRIFPMEGVKESELKNVVLQVIKNLDPNMNKKEDEIIIKLEPESLGMIRIRVLSVDSKLEVEIKTQYGFTRQLLGDTLTDLKKGLETKGFDIKEFVVSADPQGFKDHRERQEGLSTGRKMDPRFFQKEMEETVSIIEKTQSSYYNGQYNIDILA